MIDISDSIYKTEKLLNVDINGIEIENKANDGELINTMLGSDTIFPIKPQITTKRTVEDDIKNYFTKNTIFNASSNKKLKITVKSANSYWTWSDIQKLPIFGLFAIGQDVTFGMNLKILFEIEENNKVVKSYIFDETIKIKNGNASEEDIIKGYQILIKKYREIFFTDINKNFTNRYL